PPFALSFNVAAVDQRRKADDELDSSCPDGLASMWPPLINGGRRAFPNGPRRRPYSFNVAAVDQRRKARSSNAGKRCAAASMWPPLINGGRDTQQARRP